MPIRKAHNLPKVGETFTRTYNGIQHNMTAVKAKNGVGYKVENTVYRSPTGAAISITKISVNGWKFWHIEE